jgi:dTDP-4-amino-4,6-dideoxygalactose transaminase
MNQRLIPMVDLRRGYLAHRDEIDAAVRRVLESGWYILGREAEAFEAAFAHWCSTGHAIGVGNGTDAITIALRAMGIGPGDTVFTVSHTAVGTVAAIELAGATPVLVDVEPDTYTLDPVRLEQAVRHYFATGGPGTPKAVVAVHLYGQPCAMEEIAAICQRHDLRLVEDCAQAHGAVYAGKKVGTFGDMATFSFYPTKNLGAFGDGGVIVTDDAGLAERGRAVRQYGWFKHYHSDIAGQNSRLDEVQAAILAVRLAYLDGEIAERRKIARLYDEGLRGVALPGVRHGAEHAYHLYVIRTQRRDALMAILKGQGIASAIHYPLPVHLQKAYKGRLSIGPGGLGVTERLCREVLSLPMHPFLSAQDVDRVIEVVSQSA